MENLQIEFGVKTEPIEQQLNKQGYTLGDQAETFQQLEESAILLAANHILGSKEYTRVAKRLVNRIGKIATKFEKAN